MSKEKIKKCVSKILIPIIIMTVISGFLTLMLSEDVGEKTQYLDSIDYSVTLNEDGSMKVTETWDININNTNTLFKQFRLSSSKYGDITNVEVYDLDNNRKLEQINEEMYHLPKDTYYGLEINSATFEIAWGVGMDGKKGNRKYQISYVVEDVVTSYDDCQEFYWQFLGEGENTVPAKKVTGTITLPKNVSNIDNLRVWGHGQVNGNIEKVNTHEVRFDLKNLEVGAMLEIRIATQDKVFNVSEFKTRNYNYLNTMLNEETKWSEETNSIVQVTRNIWAVFIAIYVIILIINLIRIIKYRKELKESNSKIVVNELEYFRDIPRGDTATPAEAVYLYKYNKKRLGTGTVQKDAVSATILDLCLRKKIQLRMADKKKVYIKIIAEPDGLNADELEIYKLLKEVSDGEEEFEIEELNKYAKKKYQKFSDSINKFVNKARESLYDLKLIDKAEEKEYRRFNSASTKKSMLKWLYIWLIFNFFFGFIPIVQEQTIFALGLGYHEWYIKVILFFLPLVIVLMYKWHLLQKLGNKISVLTQAGSDEKEQWKGLVKFLKNYSLLSEKGVLDLVLWEKYLVFATALGIGEKVVEELKANYPEVFIQEKWDDEKMLNEYPIIYFACNPYYASLNISNSFYAISSIGSSTQKAYKTSQSQIAAHSSSSGSGGGGGFSGGGGGRRRPADGMGGR